MSDDLKALPCSWAITSLAGDGLVRPRDVTNGSGVEPEPLRKAKRGEIASTPMPATRALR